MTQQTEREKFEALMKKSPKYKPELMEWKNGRYKFDAMESAFSGFQIGLEEARAALEAQQAVQWPEPVAWLHECKKKPRLNSIAFGKASNQAKAAGFVDVPLYTEQQVRQLLSAPQPAAQERKPLSAQEIDDIWNEVSRAGYSNPPHDIARAVERAHGITGEQK